MTSGLVIRHWQGVLQDVELQIGQIKYRRVKLIRSALIEVDDNRGATHCVAALMQEADDVAAVQVPMNAAEHTKPLHLVGFSKTAPRGRVDERKRIWQGAVMFLDQDLQRPRCPE